MKNSAIRKGEPLTEARRVKKIRVMIQSARTTHYGMDEKLIRQITKYGIIRTSM